MYPRQSPTTHTEQLADEASVFDWASAQVHALNPTAALVWRHCDGATSPEAIAAALRVEMDIAEAEAVVELTLTQLARLHLLELPVASRGELPGTTRRWLLSRGVAAAMLPAIASIVAPFPVEAQSPGLAAPTLTSVSPNQGLQNTTVALNLTGTNFVADGTTVNVSGSGVTVSSIVVGSSTSLVANVEIGPTAPTGARTVTVTTARGTSGAQTFTIALPPPGTPTLTSVAPNQAIRGTTVAVTLTGTNFVVGATTVAVGGGGVTVTNVVVGSTTSLTGSFVIDPAAAAGPRTVTVTTAGGTSGSQIFTIALPPPVAPTLTSVTPNAGIQGTTVEVTLIGTNFVAGATTVNIGGGGVTIINVAVNNLAVSTGTSLVASFVLDPTAATGARSVTVTTAAGTSGAQTFTINPPPGPGTPTLTTVSPNQGLRGTTVAVTLTGSNFVIGATTVTVGGGGVTVTNVVVGSTTSLTANFVLDPSTAVGPRTVTVTTAGGTSTPQGFVINLTPPTLTSVAPNQGIRGETIAVTLTGTNFVVGGTTLTVAGGGVTATNVTVSSSTSLTANFVLDLAAAAGPRTVTVTTAGGTSGPQTFTISLPASGSVAFNFTGGPENFTVPAGVVNITIVATGAAGAPGFGGIGSGPGALGGRTTATVSVTPGASLTVIVGGQGQTGGFNGGGASTGRGGRGGGATSVRNGASPLVVVGGGGGGGAEAGGGAIVAGGNGGGGGGLVANPGGSPSSGGGGGGGGSQVGGGLGGARSSLSGTNGTDGASVEGGIGGAHQPGVIGGGGGGGGFFGGGGGGGGNPSTAGGGGGGGGSSIAAFGATGIVHENGVKGGNGSVTISW